MSDIRPTIARQAVVAAVMLAAVAAISGFGALASASNVDGWYANVTKVPWDPPNAVFAPVWTILYILIALAGFLIWRCGYRAGTRNAARGVLALFGVQLILNASWTPMFFAGYPVFGEPAWGVALAIITALIVTVVALAVAAAKWTKLASAIMVLYLLWLLFAATLNLGIIVLN